MCKISGEKEGRKETEEREGREIQGKRTGRKEYKIVYIFV